MSEPATSSIAGSLPSSSERSSSSALQIEVKEDIMEGNFYGPHEVIKGEEKKDKIDTLSNQPTSKQDYTLVDIDEPQLPLVDLIKKQMRDLESLDPSLSRASCIDRVPPEFRQVNEKSYTPQIVSIGPFHHGKKELGRWEKKKLQNLREFLDCTKKSEKSLENCIKLVKDWEKRARNCYRETIDLSSDAFVKMMLVDSCFIIQDMWRAVYNWQERTDFIVRRDMILLENQIPFFVLNGLYELGSGKEGEEKFIDLSIKYFSDNLLLTVTEDGDTERIIENVRASGVKIQHLTDLVRACHLPTILVPYRSNCVPIPTAARLHEAGMKFTTGTSKGLLDMECNIPGLLKIPKFKVEDNTECLLKNLIALETCHYPFDSYIIDYVYFTKMFIATAADVDLLIQSEIIANAPCDNAAVAYLFNNLGRQTKFGKYCFTIISKDINAYYKVSWHKWKAILKRDYCSTPWKIASTTAAIILLVLTLIQTIFSII